jgi:hypothetical protein
LQRLGILHPFPTCICAEKDKLLLDLLPSWRIFVDVLACFRGPRRGVAWYESFWQAGGAASASLPRLPHLGPHGQHPGSSHAHLLLKILPTPKLLHYKLVRVEFWAKSGERKSHKPVPRVKGRIAICVDPGTSNSKTLQTKQNILTLLRRAVSLTHYV